MKKSLVYGFVLTLLLAVPALLGFAAGSFAGGQRFVGYIEHVEHSATLAGVLHSAPLSEVQRNGYERAYEDVAGRTIPDIASNISWSVPNVPTPFVGSAPQPGEHANATINRLQMRDAREPALPRPEGVFRIFLTGGSTAFGSGAPAQESTIGALLEQRLQQHNDAVRYEVFTFANPAWSSTHERIAIENYLSELAPDLVVSLSGNNDVFWGHAGRNVLWQQIFADEYFWRLVSTALESGGREPLTALAAVVPPGEPPAPLPVATVAARLGKNARLAAHALALDGTPWVFFLQPTLALTNKSLTLRERAFLDDNRFSDPEYYRAGYAAIDEQLRALDAGNFRFVSLTGVFDARSDDIFIDSFHFGDKGNALIAEAMADAQLAQGLLPPGAP